MEQAINMNKQLAAEMESTMNTLWNTIDSFDEIYFNKIPFEGSWTPAQVSEHISKSLAGINKAVNAQTQPTKRDIRQYVAGLRDMMYNYSVKTKSAPNLVPGDDPTTKIKMKTRLKQNSEDIIRSIHDLDLSETCVSSEFPGIGYLTRLELISFAAFHTQRHIHQLKNIRQIFLTNKNKSS